MAERRSLGAERQRRLRARRAAAGVPDLDAVRRAVCGAIATMATSDPALTPAAARRIAELAIAELVASSAAPATARRLVGRVMLGLDRRRAPAPVEDAVSSPGPSAS